MAETNAAPGNRIASYVLQEELVGAATGTALFRAHDEATGRVAAVKIFLDPALAADPEFRTRFREEARAVAAVAEPHVVPVYGAGEAGGLLYIATQFVFGMDLAGLLRPVSATLAPARAAALTAQVAAALDAAHAARLVHHSVTPANILISSFPGRPEHAYLSDFGLAKLVSDFRAAHYKEEVPIGDPDYRAPEQAHRRAADGLADQYSLGCVAFRMLTGTVPFARPSRQATALAHVYQTRPRITALRAELPPAVDAVLARAMAKDPGDRYPTCGHFATALRDALPG
jgi:serine/threonine protein kinase